MRELWVGFLAEFLFEDFTGLVLVFFFAVCLVVLWVGCFAVGAGAALSGAGAGVVAPEAG